MTITPQDIQSKQFHTRLRGFDVDEVDRFLEKVAEEVLILTLENKQTFEKIESLEKEIANYRNKEQTFQNAILSAQRISEEMQEKSRREAVDTVKEAREEADTLLNQTQSRAEQTLEESMAEAERLTTEARQKARQMVDDAQGKLIELTNQINGLIGIKDRISVDLRTFLQSYLDKIEQGLPGNLAILEQLPLPQFSGGEPELPESTFPDHTPQQELETTEEETELDDLYEKINLDDEPYEKPLFARNSMASSTDDEPEMLSINDIEPLDLDDESDDLDDEEAFGQGLAEAMAGLDSDQPNIVIPDLEGDMLFSLEDPLDETDPSIVIHDDEKSR
ncbi:MAG: DivIVA domain-containing protein [Proteobacteria bacterium]|nr:DivIVA domain-containing protein [Pseudomonadota bacterium]MBU1686283.1 DivIVA domain-containing protein [Pseudomonadota bacterium]